MPTTSFNTLTFYVGNIDELRPKLDSTQVRYTVVKTMTHTIRKNMTQKITFLMIHFGEGIA